MRNLSTRIRVTQEHIDKGVRNDSNECPIALAVKAAGLPEPHISYTRATGKGWVAVLPSEASDFIALVDGLAKDKDEILPISFLLSIQFIQKENELHETS
jgi:hypothetical protein